MSVHKRTWKAQTRVGRHEQVIAIRPSTAIAPLRPLLRSAMIPMPCAPAIVGTFRVPRRDCREQKRHRRRAAERMNTEAAGRRIGTDDDHGLPAAIDHHITRSWARSKLSQLTVPLVLQLRGLRQTAAFPVMVHKRRLGAAPTARCRLAVAQTSSTPCATPPLARCRWQRQARNGDRHIRPPRCAPSSLSSPPTLRALASAAHRSCRGCASELRHRWHDRLDQARV